MERRREIQLGDAMRNVINHVAKSEAGQVISEYTIMLAMSLGVALMLVLLMAAFTEYGWRLVSLVGLEYP